MVQTPRGYSFLGVSPSGETVLFLWLLMSGEDLIVVSFSSFGTTEPQQRLHGKPGIRTHDSHREIVIAVGCGAHTFRCAGQLPSASEEPMG